MADIAILTDATSTIGREFCHQLEQGRGGPLDEIWAIVPTEDEAEHLTATFKHDSIPIIPLVYDLTKSKSFDQLEARLQEARPKVRWLINCVLPTPTSGSGLEATAADLVRRVVVTTTETCSRVLPYLVCGSRIVNLSSVAGAVPEVDLIAHSAACAFVLELTRLLDHDLKSVGIRAVCVCPRPLKQDTDKDNATGGHLIDHIGCDDVRSVVSRALTWSILGIPVLIPSHKARLTAFCARHIPRRVLFAVEDGVKTLLKSRG